MTSSLRALLEGILDDAGLFPPAALAMGPAVARHARDREGAHAWMMGRFVCPAARLEEFEAVAGRSIERSLSPWHLAILAGPVADGSAFLDGLRQDLDRAGRAGALWPGRLVPDVMEVSLPPGVVAAGPDPVYRLVKSMATMIASHPARPGTLFLETGFPDNGDHRVREIILALGGLQQAFPVRLGVKLRTGGLEAAAFPDPARVAGFVVAAREAGLPFKATAGLHHPIRHHRDEVGTKMHGFLNLFTGAVLAHARGWDAAALQRVLEEEDPMAFAFSDDGVSWRGEHAGIDLVRRLRREFAVSFGSCSFEEPVEDLAALRLL